MDLHRISFDLPIGSKVCLNDDRDKAVHEVQGYEWYRDTGNVLFRDGTKLSMDQMDSITKLH